MLVLFEIPPGFALFKVLDEGKLSRVKDLWKEFSSADSARRVVKLKAFLKFENVSEAVTAATLLADSKPSKGLRKFLRAHCEGETLAVADSKLGRAIREKLQIECVHNNAVRELMRGVRSQLSELISGLAAQDLNPMRLGLSHCMYSEKLKFDPNTVDTMVIHAIRVLDDIDKELNTYAMRVREWYGWHFPELAKIVQDNILYVKSVILMGDRTNAANLNFSEILPEEVETELKEAVIISVGAEISEHDLVNIKHLCHQVLSFAEYRAQLYDYLKSRMNTIAPNLTALVGELVGARLIAHCGNLLNLAKQAGSTIQIIGAEKALFKALKAKHATPKYGLIFHAPLIVQAASKHKGKMSRSLAAKVALATRIDALGDPQDGTWGLQQRAKLETRLRVLEHKKKKKKKRNSKDGSAELENEVSEKEHKKKNNKKHASEQKNEPKNSEAGEKKKKRKHPKANEEVETPSEKKKEKEKKTKKTELRVLETVEKKKKKKRNSKDGSAELENEVSEKKHKKKNNKKHATEDSEQKNEPKNSEAGEKKKKRKHPKANEEVETPGEKKKEKEKKTKKTELRGLETVEKKKKKKKHATEDSEQKNEPKNSEAGEKKKKRKHPKANEEVETPGEKKKEKEKKTKKTELRVLETVEKKKKKKKHATEDSEQKNEPKNSEAGEKKEKRKHPTANEEVETPSKKREKKKKKKNEE